jgi:hypothetical protein
LLFLVVGGFLTVGAGVGTWIEPAGAGPGVPEVRITKEFVGPPPAAVFIVNVDCGALDFDASFGPDFNSPDDFVADVDLGGVSTGASCAVTEPQNPCAPPDAVISPSTFSAPVPNPMIPVLVTVTNDCLSPAKAVNGWNTRAEVDRPENFYCVDMKTVAVADNGLATGKVKVRVLKSKFDACDKRVRNLNLGSTADVEVDGTPILCSETGHGEVTVPGTKLLNAKASESLFFCAGGFIVSGQARVLVGKNKDGMSPPTVVNISQSGPGLG